MGGCFSKKYTQPERPYQPQPRQERPYQRRPPPKPQPQPQQKAHLVPVTVQPGQPQDQMHGPNLNNILGKPFEDIRKLYTLGKKLGRGQFGVTYYCTEISTGNPYACKSILKRKLVSKNDREDMKREIQIMQHLSGQPNIVEFKGAYEDRQSVHLVMELCAGGQLLDRIIARSYYSEKDAAEIIRQIVTVVNICHFMGVMHRDLKPENFLLTSKDENAMLKAIDFGLSVFIECQFLAPHD